MIATAISTVKTHLTSLGIIDRYGGLAIPLGKVEQVSDDRFVTKVYPIREGVDARDCFTKGKYQDLIPSDKYENIVYWEEISGLSEYSPSRSEDRGVKFLHFRGQARLVYWLNLPNMGHGNDTYRTVGDSFAWTMVDQLKGQFRVDSGNFSGLSVTFTNARQSARNTSIFTKYSYPADVLNTYLLYPYDFGAIDFDVNVVVPAKCVSNYTANGDALECVTEW